MNILTITVLLICVGASFTYLGPLLLFFLGSIVEFFSADFYESIVSTWHDINACDCAQKLAGLFQTITIIFAAISLLIIIAVLTLLTLVVYSYICELRDEEKHNRNARPNVYNVVQYGTERDDI